MADARGCQVVLREFLVRGVVEAYRPIAVLLETRELLASRLEGRELGEVLSDESVTVMLLAGLRPSYRGDAYPGGSLARFYRDVLGLGLSMPRRVAARLSDGVPLSLAGRGVRVRASSTRPLVLLGAIRGLLSRLAGQLGIALGEPGEVDTDDPLWGLKLLGEALKALAGLVPPYSREAMLLAGSRAALGEYLESYGVLGELVELGLELVGDGFYRVRKGSPLETYTCLYHAVWRLMQLREIQAFYAVPDPAAEAVERAYRILGRNGYRVLEALSMGARIQQCMETPGTCSIDPPCMPQGYRYLVLEAEARDGKLVFGGSEHPLDNVFNALQLLALHGLASVEPAGDNKVVIGYAFTPYPPLEPEQPKETLREGEPTVQPPTSISIGSQPSATRVGPPESHQ
ncbi:hypothetical protein Hbut_1029 [Hyperthermus butylicus DSM 5456]|uniref:Uncharacterized protein n=1 Tax=Hyperthermus butylicus (strain DSM 5456 / JCM 9403 / PLM1-5) TaxID=415426 RepID=A2BLL2_HYPBU|nr:hypothetical protein Hbut_1029 [Hyperthermus butylicus DSM 5456]